MSGLFTDTDWGRDSVDRAVKVAFKDTEGLHGYRGLHADRREAGWKIIQKDGRGVDTLAGPGRPNVVLDLSRLAEGKPHLATVIDLYSRRLLGAATSAHPDLDLACAAIRMAVTARGGKEAIWREEQSERVVFDTDSGSTYTAGSFIRLCTELGIRSRWAGSARALDNAPRRRSSPPWSWRSCPGTSSTPGPGPGQSSSTGPTGSIDTSGATALLA